MKVVLDAGVVFSAAGWRGEAHRCLVAMARRRIATFATEDTIKELRELVAGRGHRGSHSPVKITEWYLDNVKRVEPSPLGKQRSRDPKDDPYLACALAAGAKFIISRDDDLLTLGKPFGIEIITPRELLVRLAGASRER
jgi:putative PIN family toxin of toxin-antitoxin system